MAKPDKPANEEQRLAALRDLHLLDTDAEERFDRVTRLARRLFNVPIAFISLIDEERQWFKSCVGIDADHTPREISFCAHTILGSDAMVVSDALLDERFADNPLVTGEPHIRFYAGRPLTVNGFQVGTLCVIDAHPREFSEQDLQALHDLAAMVEEELVTLKLATIDYLTGLSNRVAFVSLASQSMKLCKRQKIPASLVYMDIDRLKSINDTYGHAAGDEALTLFAHTMSNVFRESDVYARLGGDEFVIFLSNADVTQAEVSVGHFRQALAAAGSGHDEALGFSHGIVEYDPAVHDSIGELLNAGDTLMYQQKQQKKSTAATN